MATAAVKKNKKTGDRFAEPPISTEEVLTLPVETILKRLETSQTGLTTEDAEKRLGLYGTNDVARQKDRGIIVEFLSHFSNPLVMLLVVAATISGLLGEPVNAAIIFVIVLVSVILDFVQQYRANKAAEELKKRVATTAAVFRDRVQKDIGVGEIVPGDIVALSAGDIIPADARVITARDFFVDQSALTGESFPAEKTTELQKDNDITNASGRNNYLFMGTSVRTGTCLAVIVKTGTATEYGEIVEKIVERKPNTEFERGIRRFGVLIMRITFLLVVFVFFINALFKRDILESMLFSVALAVGLTPELLPMILSINLSKGAIAMSKKGVIVKRLSSIQNFGSMNILCTDKTGTLTENRVTVVLHIDIEGENDEKVFLYSFLNSRFQTGLRSPLDESVLKHEEIYIKDFMKVDEIPFDFVRRRVSVVVDEEDERYIISKGAPEEIVRVSTYYELDGKVGDLTTAVRRQIDEKFRALSADGFRVLGIASKKVTENKCVYSVGDEKDMVFQGLIAFLDPPKESAKESLRLLRKAGIELKVLTGDNELVTRKICEELGFDIKRIVLGTELNQINDTALLRVVEETNIFARVNPTQKNRVIAALKANDNVVGYLGDGINDTPSMKVADVSISVENAVDIAKDSADIILLKKDLNVLEQGVMEGRKTFANTMKYVFTTMSANFGNMFSMAGLSLFLDFLPLLPTQILLNNFLSDIPATAITTDSVDAELIEKPRRWDIRFIRDFMVIFGLVSSVFDFMTFGLLLLIFHASPDTVRTAWFVESLMTELVVALVVRTRKPFFKSRPGKYYLWVTIAVAVTAIIIPYLPLHELFEFTPLPIWLMAGVLGITMLYVLATEAAKRFFYARIDKYTT
jgi:Mg2+-importing ATPase